MAKNIKVKLNSKGVRGLLKSEETQGILKDYGANVQSRAGTGYKMDSYVGRNRANSMVWADTFRARYKNKKNNTLLKALK